MEEGRFCGKCPDKGTHIGQPQAESFVADKGVCYLVDRWGGASNVVQLVFDVPEELLDTVSRDVVDRVSECNGPTPNGSAQSCPALNPKVIELIVDKAHET